MTMALTMRSMRLFEEAERSMLLTAPAATMLNMMARALVVFAGVYDFVMLTLAKPSKMSARRSVRGKLVMTTGLPLPMLARTSMFLESGLLLHAWLCVVLNVSADELDIERAWCAGVSGHEVGSHVRLDGDCVEGVLGCG